MRGWRIAGFVLMVLLALVVAVTSLRYFFASPETYFEQQRETYEANLAFLRLHVGGGLVALLLGPWQFVARLRERHLVLTKTKFSL